MYSHIPSYYVEVRNDDHGISYAIHAGSRSQAESYAADEAALIENTGAIVSIVRHRNYKVVHRFVASGIKHQPAIADA